MIIIVRITIDILKWYILFCFQCITQPTLYPLLCHLLKHYLATCVCVCVCLILYKFIPVYIFSFFHFYLHFSSFLTSKFQSIFPFFLYSSSFLTSKFNPQFQSFHFSSPFHFHVFNFIPSRFLHHVSPSITPFHINTHLIITSHITLKISFLQVFILRFLPKHEFV